MIMLLFDVDGTLLLTGGCGQVAFDRTFKELFGIKNACGHLKPHGKTDPIIIEELIEKNLNRVLDPVEYETLCRRYLFYFSHALQNACRFRLMPGVAALLKTLSEQSNLLIGLATGNLEQTAWLKLARGGIRHHFQFGGFGSDSSDRTQLTKAAVERGQALWREPIPRSQIYVVGDTPYDIQAASALGLRSIVVTTGIHTQEELLAHKPTHCLRDLTDVDQFLRLIV